MIHFEIPRNQSSIIKVIGVGGGGSNAVNYMHGLGIEGVDFIVCNTDSQALALSPVANKIQLGPHLTQGLGAGANPEIGKQASEESLEDITKILKVNTRMAFITAGMGGGTGTGGAPVVAKICKDLGILTVGIVTMPFTYEGRRRMKQAQDGIDRMREHVDTILVVSNDKLRQQFGNLPYRLAFSKADDILATAAKCITDVINTTGQINVDFADVCTVMRDGGVAILGSAAVAGENRALHAVEEALNSPLLNDSDISGAKWLLLNITSAAGEFEHTMDETEAVQAYVQRQAGENCDVILGMGNDPNLNDKIAVTIIATGFEHRDIKVEFPAKTNEPKKEIWQLGKDPMPETLPQDSKPFTGKITDSLMPTLVEMPMRNNNSFDNNQADANFGINKDAIKPSFTWPNMEPAKPTADQNFVFNLDNSSKDEKKEEESVSKSNYKNEPVSGAKESVPYKIGERILSDEEMEEKRRFEEQKRALEERAERLRRMSFNIKNAESNDEFELVPAYKRKNILLDNQQPSTDNYYSKYTVDVNDTNKGPEVSLHTINTFLDGKKPD